MGNFRKNFNYCTSSFRNILSKLSISFSLNLFGRSVYLFFIFLYFKFRISLISGYILPKILFTFSRVIAIEWCSLRWWFEVPSVSWKRFTTLSNFFRPYLLRVIIFKSCFCPSCAFGNDYPVVMVKIFSSMKRTLFKWAATSRSIDGDFWAVSLSLHSWESGSNDIVKTELADT